MDTQSWNNVRELNVLVDDPTTTKAWSAAVFEPARQHGIPAREQCLPTR